MLSLYCKIVFFIVLLLENKLLNGRSETSLPSSGLLPIFCAVITNSLNTVKSFCRSPSSVVSIVCWSRPRPAC